jgi:hypothetical protein
VQPPSGCLRQSQNWRPARYNRKALNAHTVLYLIISDRDRRKLSVIKVADRERICCQDGNFEAVLADETLAKVAHGHLNTADRRRVAVNELD